MSDTDVDIVVQGTHVENDDLATLAAIADPDAIEAIQAAWIDEA